MLKPTVFKHQSLYQDHGKCTYQCQQAVQTRLNFNKCATTDSPASVQAADTMQLSLSVGSFNIPNPEKASYGGEDAFFVSSLRGGIIGVADGVGGWVEQGINAADYSKAIMKVTENYLAKKLAPPPPPEPKEDGEEQEPQPQVEPPQLDADLLKRALDIAHRTTRVPGSSTTLVLGLEPATKKLIALNVGDCKFIVVRGGQVHFQCRILQHTFDMPYQLGACPEYVQVTNYAYDGDDFTIDVEEGDVIIAASDGLWDNMFEEELLSLMPKTSEDVQASAQKIAEKASRNAENEEFDSPYTIAAKREGQDLSFWEKLRSAKLQDGRFQLGELQGGKVDDITVCLAMVVATKEAGALGATNNFQTIETKDLKEGKGLEVKV